MYRELGCLHHSPKTALKIRGARRSYLNGLREVSNAQHSEPG